MKDVRLQEDWRSTSLPIADPSNLTREFRRQRRRLTLVLAAELATLGALLGIAGFALLRSPLISDTLWAVTLVLFLVTAASSVLLARRNVLLPAAHTATETYLAAYQSSCRRKLLLIRLAGALLITSAVALVPFAIRRYRADTFLLTSGHGAFSALATLLLLISAAVAIGLSHRRTRAELERILTLRKEPSSLS